MRGNEPEYHLGGLFYPIIAAWFNNSFLFHFLTLNWLLCRFVDFNLWRLWKKVDLISDFTRIRLSTILKISIDITYTTIFMKKNHETNRFTAGGEIFSRHRLYQPLSLLWLKVMKLTEGGVRLWPFLSTLCTSRTPMDDGGNGIKER